MKTITQVKKENPDYSALIQAVVSRIGKESIEDVINHGIDGGFGGFIYYTDTVKFWKTYRKIITEMAESMAEDMGVNVLDMIGGFNCLGYYDHKTSRWTDKEGHRTVAETFYGRKTDDLVANALAWFAAEEVCRMFEK